MLTALAGTNMRIHCVYYMYHTVGELIEKVCSGFHQRFASVTRKIGVVVCVILCKIDTHFENVYPRLSLNIPYARTKTYCAAA